MSKINKLKQISSSNFDVNDLGTTKIILGMEIEREYENGMLYLSQSMYIEKVFEKVNVVNTELVSTLLASHFNLSASQRLSVEAEREYMKKISYERTVGCLMCARIYARPDLA